MKFQKSFWKNIQLSTHKNLEFQLEIGWNYNLTDEWFEFILKTRSKQDHWGAEFCITLVKLVSFMINFYDDRHYEDENEH